MHNSINEYLPEKTLVGNNELAQHNRQYYDKNGLWAVNIISAPGGGNTSLLEATISKLLQRWKTSVIESDLVREPGAERLRQAGAKVAKFYNGRKCHLDAQTVVHLLNTEDLAGTECLFFENVGSFVCAPDFSLGEHSRVVLLSVAESDHKPIKYPAIFSNCDVVIFTKCDLLPFGKFNVNEAIKNVRALNADVKFFVVSVVSGEGLTDWIDWLNDKIANYRVKKTTVLV